MIRKTPTITLPRYGNNTQYSNTQQTKPQYIKAFDPTIQKTVLFIVQGNIATSTMTGHKFQLK
jgi:hypothetical protein